MKWYLAFILMLLDAFSASGQIHLDLFGVPVRAWELDVPAEDEMFMIPIWQDTLCFSSDNGASWSVAAVPRTWARYAPSYSLSTQSGGRAMLAFDERNESKDTQYVSILVTLDTGKSWKTSRFPVTDRLPLPMMSDIRDYTLCDDTTVYLRSESNVFRSTDTGASWHEVPDLKGMQGLHFLNSQTGCAQKSIGASTIITSTTDGGMTWINDTLDWNIGGLQCSYDGSLLASVVIDSGPPYRYFARTIHNAWEKIFWPSGDVIKDLDLSWSRMLFLGDDSFLAMASDNMQKGYMFVTRYRGAHWARLHYVKAAWETEWYPFTTHYGDAWRTGRNRVVVKQSWDSLATLQVQMDSPTIVSAEDFSTTTRMQSLVHWSDPFDGRTMSVDIERSAADSMWTVIATDIPSQQQYLDSTIAAATPVRYRVTSRKQDGASAEGLSNDITPQLGSNLDILDYILPGEDNLLRYAVMEIDGNSNFNTADTLNYEISLLFLPTVDSSSSIRLHPVRSIRHGRAGVTDTTYGRIIEYLDIYHHFHEEFVYPGLACALRLPWTPYLSPGPKYRGIVSLAGVDPRIWNWDFTDSVFIHSACEYPMAFASSNRYTALRGLGIRTLSFFYELSHVHSYTHDQWQLIDHVSGADTPPHPSSGLALTSYPNPVSISTSIRYHVPVSAETSLTVHDMLGRLVHTVVRGHHPGGKHVAVFNATGLPPGMYLLTLRQGTQTAVRKLLKL